MRMSNAAGDQIGVNPFHLTRPLESAVSTDLWQQLLSEDEPTVLHTSVVDLVRAIRDVGEE